METIYCTACNEKVTLHADCTFACSCEGPINPLDGGAPIPESWEMPGEDADSVYYELRRAVGAEKHYQSIGCAPTMLYCCANCREDMKVPTYLISVEDGSATCPACGSILYDEPNIERRKTLKDCGRR